MKSRVIRGYNCLSSPSNNDNNDFIYYVDAINDTLFTSVIAIDVRTNCVYRNNMIDGNWIGWDKFVLNSDLNTEKISLENTWVWSSGSLKMQRVFDCVFLEFEAIYGSITEKTTIATIPEGWRPFQWKTTIGVSGTTPVRIIIGTDGRIYSNKALPTSDIVINTMWMIR